jgi:hypothetical protein
MGDTRNVIKVGTRKRDVELYDGAACLGGGERRIKIKQNEVTL